MNFSNFHLSSSGDSLKYGQRLRPVRDWFILLALLGVLLLCGIVWSAYTYVAVEHGEVIGNAPAPVHAPVDRASIQSVEDLFAGRAAEAAKYTTGAYTFVDPSK